MGSEAHRLKLMEKLKTTFILASQQNKPISKKRTVATFCVETGYTQFKANEYLNVLKDAGLITIEEDIIKCTEEFIEGII